MVETILSSSRQFHCNDVCIEALHWRIQGREPSRKILCIHGWLDNAASFNLLAPKLVALGYEVLAIDFAGNGKSSHRALHGYYNLWDDLIDIRAILQELDWNDYALLGHSRGAAVASLYASTQPAGLACLVLLDGILPPEDEVSALPDQLQAFLEDRDRAVAKTESLKPVMAVDEQSEPISARGCMRSMEEAWRKRNGTYHLELEELAPLLERGMRICGRERDGTPCYRWSHDQRWLSRSLYRLSNSDRAQVLDSIAVPTFLLAAANGRVGAVEKDSKLQIYDACKTLEFDTHEGVHHFHMQRKHVDSIAARLDQWLRNLNSV